MPGSQFNIVNVILLSVHSMFIFVLI